MSWIVNFTRRHGAGPVSRDETGSAVMFIAADGSAAECHPPFPPLSGGAGGGDPAAAAEQIVTHAMADRTVGVFSGAPSRLVSSKTGSRPVHGRSAAGGWSQQRFARRRENQAAIALRAAADTAAGVFGQYGADGLDAVVLGGDKRALAVLRGDPRLAPYLDRATDRFLTVPDPRPAVLRDVPSAYLAIRIRLTEPQSDGRT